ncbi:hypothetical protein [Raoultibacter phocaeensis]|uniref:hypothetical protein n=1 Tax=Raoultibacter phocaeensis TaxID=2479841 RepID=UPI00111A6034|nr:hypothetical protein [Raoultibacter phocaeensis]
MIAEVIEFIGTTLFSVLGLIVSFFPDSWVPDNLVLVTDNEIMNVGLGMLNWLVPIPSIIDVAMSYAGAMLLLAAVQWFRSSFLGKLTKDD